MPKRDYDIDQELPQIGKRAEILVSWYLRFNGYFPIQNFILHDAGKKKQPGGQLTDTDILAVRLPFTVEKIQRKMKNDDIIVTPHILLDVKEGVLDFIIVEVTSKDECKFNWFDNNGKSIKAENISYVLRRFGWWQDKKIKKISETLSSKYYFSEKIKIDDSELTSQIRFLCIGRNKKPDFALKQITFIEVLTYLKSLFSCYGCRDDNKKILSDHKQWDPLIREIYKRLHSHKKDEQNPDEVLNWLFPKVDNI